MSAPAATISSTPEGVEVVTEAWADYGRALPNKTGISGSFWADQEVFGHRGTLENKKPDHWPGFIDSCDQAAVGLPTWRRLLFASYGRRDMPLKDLRPHHFDALPLEFVKQLNIVTGGVAARQLTDQVFNLTQYFRFRR
jgi:hypothetical protein